MDLLQFDGLYETGASRTDPVANTWINDGWRFYPDGTAVSLALLTREPLDRSTRFFSKRLPGLFGSKRKDIYWYRMNGNQITIGLEDQVLWYGDFMAYGKIVELKLYSVKDTSKVHYTRYTFHRMTLPRE